MDDKFYGRFGDLIVYLQTKEIPNLPLETVNELNEF